MSDSPERSVAAELEANLEVWKHVVSVQQHFNDIGWRIRSLAITALTFFLGATFFGFLNAGHVTLVGREFNPAILVPVLGLLIWLIFWFADGVWYHRLLSGAGAAASTVEDYLNSYGVHADLSKSITNASHRKWFGCEMSSTRKLNIFYLSGTVLLIVTGLGVAGLQSGYSPRDSGTPSKSAITPAADTRENLSRMNHSPS
ncbi:hypothetical protein GCM10022261_13590 [Brevibacterium daeguense]|uniref:Uncharacterized protein n=1 Tax=Brevibacterium daeguense TaxID=909936 RepID=A0ABP8EIN3_9MICO|nr:hypothetical protein [Brevibacterium daeguense]